MQVREVAPGGKTARQGSGIRRVGVVDGALGSREQFERLSDLFPGNEFMLLPPDWDGSARSAPEILIVGIDSSDGEAACGWLKGISAGTRVVVILHDADVPTTRKLLREGGAADVLPAPVGEPALASSLDRLLSTPVGPSGQPRQSGRVVSMLKAGGGVGATSLAAQVGALLARQSGGSVCLADLDLQSGAASAYLDLPDAVTVMDCLTAGSGLAETPFATALATHPSGLRLLAAPGAVVPLEALTPTNVEALLVGLRRDAALTILDLPSIWTAWTHHALQQSDGIVIVTKLTVPHMQLVKRQLRMLVQQHLDTIPVTLVCNALSGDQSASLSIKSATKALGREFDFVVPEDERLFSAAVNQGVELSTIKRGSKAEKAIAELGAAIAADALAPVQKRRGW